MSIFVSGLAFDDATLITESKLGILVASVVAGLAGYLLLRSSTDGSEASSESREVA
jgi:NhaA family Na+:H+ antiporter